ncbi:DUF222 domain-containing protein [Arthrobacter yangruifuii]|uniref:DUF222 domain-containing protein n=1 Tax=Arthrobacter yangruifuii TaxID=2606616 RepID=A0A5N6MGH5_9MICC|nr:HNH endonuclease signature motif containing protein [Arthrobacter yangruifuii]KAD3514978.1 DUF222 domain-containing protein [Arthrobacter yangruifuii]
MQSYEFHVSETGAACTGQETCADAAAPVDDGLSGDLRLRNLQSLGRESILRTVESLASLIGWAQAQEARAVTRLDELVTRDVDPDGSQGDICDSQTAFRLVASELGALLSLPPMTAQRLVIDSSTLCSECPAVLADLEAGRLSYRKAQIICSTVASLPEPTRVKLESQLLSEAQGLTAAQLERKARRLYEGMVPESELAVRHRRARSDRRVTLEPQQDGMCFLGARLPAPEGQAIFTGLTTCARSEQAAGDSRTVDQLRADMFTSLLLGGNGGIEDRERPTSRSARSGDRLNGSAKISHRNSPRRPLTPLGPRVKAEVMVLINAETLLGLDNKPAELHGYGPISAEAARELVRSIGHWTGLLRSGSTGEILDVGRQRRVPPGLRRWLQARDSTCRFPGCSANVITAEIDHTVPWARGGPTVHGLECLCRKHHALKTAGFWTARQPAPGLLEWTSPAGRRYQTRAHLHLSMGGNTTGPVGAKKAETLGGNETLGGSRTGVRQNSALGDAAPAFGAGNRDHAAVGDPPPF